MTAKIRPCVVVSGPFGDAGRAKETYKRRGATSECVNAHFRNQGLLRLLVRGTRKALAVSLMHAIASNMRRGWALAVTPETKSDPNRADARIDAEGRFDRSNADSQGCSHAER
jgi:hypothetical protein